MFKNYFYLLRCVKELSDMIRDKRIAEVYTQEKDKLFLRIPFADNQNFHVIISASPQSPFITIKHEHFKAKKNVKIFYENFIPDVLNKIEIARGDRIVKFSLSESTLYFVVRGAATNIFLSDKHSNLHAFKKVPDNQLDEIKSQLCDLTFVDNEEWFNKLIFESDGTEIKNELKLIGKDILNESNIRGENRKKNLIAIVDEIMGSQISVGLKDNMTKPFFMPSTFAGSQSQFLFDDYFSALNKYFQLYYTIGKDKIIKSEIEKYIEKEIERVANKLNNLKSRIENGSNEDEYFAKANLLLSNIHQLQKGIKEIELDDFTSNSKIKIKLDEKLSPKQNVDSLFEKARSEKINFHKSKELFEATEKEYKKLLGLQNKVSNAATLDQLIEIKKALKIKMDIQKQDYEKDRIFNFRHYLIEGKYHLYVGKDSKNNDLLTTKFAKQNDFWFHARSVSGSHAVLRVENTKEAIPKNIIKKAASVAAFYSKAKTSKMAPVSYTFKKYVVKKKDLDPGQVILLKEDVILVTPEIPVGCDIIVED
jgi:predicted ribosome quality control (RQC) complex YloA/Tae2 family protein